MGGWWERAFGAPPPPRRPPAASGAAAELAYPPIIWAHQPLTDGGMPGFNPLEAFPAAEPKEQEFGEGIAEAIGGRRDLALSPELVASLTDKQQSADNRRCRDLVADAFVYDGNVRFLNEALLKLGVSVRERVKCRGTMMHTRSGQGGYVWDDIPKVGLKKGDIVINQGGGRSAADQQLTRAQVSMSLRHEMIHAYDAARAHTDCANCLHHACSEIRAAHLSGECVDTPAAMQQSIFTVHNQLGVDETVGTDRFGAPCVRRRSRASVAQNPACSREGVADDAVERVWLSCYPDNAPYLQFPISTQGFMYTSM